MAIDDDALLQRELYWRARPGDRRRPAGGNAVMAIGIVITLVLWAITGVVLGRLLAGRPTSSGVIDPISVVVLMVFGVELFIAAAVSARIWVAIGPTARNILRPFGVLGAWPMLIMGFLAALYVVALVVGPFMPRTPEPPTSGRNWHILDTGGGVSYEDALERCKQIGERVPSRDDLAAFDPPYAGGTSAWLERSADDTYFPTLTRDGTIALLSLRPGQPGREYVICFRP